MPILDMPLEQLKTYQGRNECPADIDEYWDKAIAEMEVLGTDYELVPSEVQFPGAECYHLYFTGVGGARIHAKFIKPAKLEGKAPAVVCFHGYSGDSHSYFSRLGYTNAGFVVAALDCRGQGGPSEDVGGVKGNTLNGHIIRGLDDDKEKLYYRSVYLDCAQLARILMAMPFVDETKVAATGNSQGGGLTLACAALTPTLNRAAAIHPFLCDYRRVWEMDLAKDAYKEIKDYFFWFDPKHERESEVFERLGYIDNQHMAHRIKAKIKLFTGLMDNVCPPSTQFAAYNKIQSQKEVVLYPDYGHQYLPGHDDEILMFLAEMLQE